MLQVSKRVEYALRATIFLATLPKEARASFKAIAEQQQIPADFLAKILRSLVSEGIATSTRGPHGGFALARPAEQITFLQVIEAADGPIALNECCEQGDGCVYTHTCEMQHVWRRGEAAMLEVFRNTRISELARTQSLAAARPASEAVGT